MAERGISVKGTFQGQQIITALNRINGQLLAVNNQMRKQGALSRKITTGHKAAAGAAKGHASAMKGLALRFVGYNLVLGAVMGAQQKLIQFVSESIDKYREFELRLAEISTILQEDIVQMDRFKTGIQGLSTTYGQATSDISKGMYDILSAAFSASDAMNLLNTSIKASIAGLSDVRTSVKIFTTVLNSYGKSAEQATHVSDVLFQSVVRGKFQFADLEQALGYVVPIAAQAGISFDELSAALSTATRHGLHIDMTARGLALAIQGIINPSEKARKAAMKYGVEMNGLSLRVLGLKGWFDQLGEAMDEHGKSVLGQLIPNMRSLRVAMVLAGEEGALGFAEDLKYLENVTGRTDEALQKIMETSSIAAKKLGEELELRMRTIGSDWDEMALGLKEGALNVIDALKVGEDFTRNPIKAMRKWIDAADDVREVNEKFTNIDTKDAVKQVENYITAFKESEKLSTEMAGMDTDSREYERAYEQLKLYDEIMLKSIDSYNRYVGAVKDTQDALGDLEVTLDEVNIDVARLNKELVDSITVGWGKYQQSIAGTLGLELAQLEMAQKLKDSQHDVKMGLIDSTYEWKTNNSALQEAVNIVREHEDAQKKDTEATNRMNIAMRQLQIEMLELQLIGMMKRRGLSRTEQKLMKQLQIEQAKLRLENMKNTKLETVEMYDNYNDKKQFIAEFLAKLEEESYQLHYKYDNDITELNTYIDSEKEALETRASWWEVTNAKIYENSTQLIRDLANLPAPLKAFMQEDGYDIEEMLASATERQTGAKEAAGTYGNYVTRIEPMHEVVRPGEPRHSFYYSSSGARRMAEVGEFKMGDIANFRRGIEYMPETKPIIAHRGEKILAAGKDVDSGTRIDSVTINVKSLEDISSVEKFAAVLSEAKDTRIITTTKGRARNKKIGNSYRVM